MAGPHAETRHLQRTTAIVDAADEALFQTEGLLAQARAIVGSYEVASIDPLLAAIDAAAAGPTLGGAAILHEGITLRAGNGSIDLGPATTEHLGAVMVASRSHRLCDLRSGGTLDSAGHQTSALRSLDAASQEVASARIRLLVFRSEALSPAQRDALTAVRTATDTGPWPATEAQHAAAAIRDTLVSSAPLAQIDANAVWALLG